MDQEARRVLAAAIVEALETGNPVAPLPDALRPADATEGEGVAEEVIDLLDLPVCGLRLLCEADGARVAGPLVGQRVLRDGAALPVPALRHARVSAAVLAVLAEPLDPGATATPRFAAVHPALDIAVSRFRDGAAGVGELAADLAGLGYLVPGRRGALPAGPIAASCALAAKRPKGRTVHLAALLAEAVAAARRLGGLPAGGMLAVAGLTPPAAPAEGQEWAARLAGLGAARARFVAGVPGG